jgi:hypothetical protein
VRKGLLLVLSGFWVSALAVLAQDSPEAMSVTFQGTGPTATRPFVTQKGWHVIYQAKAGIRIKAISTDGTFANVLTDSSNENSTAHNGTTDDTAKTGGFTLEIKTAGAWQVTVVETGFAQNGEFSSPAATAAVPTPSPVMPSQMVSRSRADLVEQFSGQGGADNSHTFTVKDGWALGWSALDRIKITLTTDDTADPIEVVDFGTSSGDIFNYRPIDPLIAPPYIYDPKLNTTQSHIARGTSRQTHGGIYTLHVRCSESWQVAVYQIVSVSVESPLLSQAGNFTTNAATTPTPSAPAPIVKLTENQARAVVLIKGDKAEGTGFLVKMADGPSVVTNIHVISANPHIKITTTTGVDIPILSLKGASDRDLAVFAIKDNNYNYLDLAPDVSATVQTGDDVVTPGNSEGGEVMLNTGGKVQGIGPQRVEFDNPIYHGNSGGPVFHTKSGKVIAVVTEAMKVNVSDDLDKTSFQSRNSAISGSMRYFGLRLDTVPHWDVYDWKRFLNETQFLDEFHQESRCLDSFLNAPDKDSNGNANPDATLYLTDEKIRAANDSFSQRAGDGVDSAQRLDALRILLFDLTGIADNNVANIQNMANFYPFDQEQAKDEIAYRKALKTELDSIGNNVTRLNSLHR